MCKKVLSSIAIIISLFTTSNSYSQNPVNWTPKQLVEPADLAKDLHAKTNVPIIISVGPGAVIPGSLDVGMVNDDDGLNKFKKTVAGLPKQKKIIVYCGCCPFEHCPNVRPAIQVLKDQNFTNYHLLDLKKNIKTDWIDKGFPTSKS